MMTVNDITTILTMLESNYGMKFYDGAPKENVIALWISQFKNDDPAEVLEGVQNCIATLSYKPTIADIRKRMAGNAMLGQMTSIEAFHEISKAVAKSYDRDSATQAYNELPGILRKVVGFPARLTTWRKISDESFETVIMSAIRESYRELAQREADYHALPKPLQAKEQWRLDAPDQEALPEPENAQSIDEVIEQSNREAAAHGMTMTDELAEKHAWKVADFLKPMTEDEKKHVELAENRKAEWSLK